MISLLFDGLTGAIQERMRASYKVTSTHLMFFLNFWASLILIGICIISGEFLSFYRFCVRSPTILKDILLFAISSAVGQCFIFKTITNLGPLMCSIITTTRKLFTILLSVLLFGNKLSTFQWIGVTMVFTGITLDSTKLKHN
ncbi:hypothetical protein MXB_3175 [Myxobolus squamalis]|nr:hypothetical protein MXB_3175 [Myxobolus squamalis]